MKFIYKSILAFAVVSFQLAFAGQKSSISDVAGYKNACLKGKNNMANFKSDANYTAILEHVSYAQGLEYLNYIKNNYSSLLSQIDKFKRNDLIGNPSQFVYPSIGKISPTTLRYIKIAGDLQFFFGNLENKQIVEIGGGYGGQAYILSQLYNLERYSLIDLAEALALQDKYLSQLNVSHECIQTNELDQIEPYNLVVSNYAFTECNRAVQEEYLEKVIAKASNGYMICNQITQGTGIAALSKDELIIALSNLGFNVKLLDENPNTHSGNYLLVFQK
jgi:hypothetical protein